jgi:hypothetical protein
VFHKLRLTNGNPPGQIDAAGICGDGENGRGAGLMNKKQNRPQHQKMYNYFHGPRLNRDFPFELMFMIQLSLTSRFRDYPLVPSHFKPFFNTQSRFFKAAAMVGTDFYTPTRSVSRRRRQFTCVD